MPHRFHIAVLLRKLFSKKWLGLHGFTLYIKYVCIHTRPYFVILFSVNNGFRLSNKKRNATCDRYLRSFCLFRGPKMATARKCSNNDTGTDDDSSNCAVADVMEVLVDENPSSIRTSNHTLRLWQEGSSRPASNLFHGENCEITIDQSENSSLGFLKLFS